MQDSLFGLMASGSSFFLWVIVLTLLRLSKLNQKRQGENFVATPLSNRGSVVLWASGLIALGCLVCLIGFFEKFDDKSIQYKEDSIINIAKSATVKQAVVAEELPQNIINQIITSV